MHECWDHTTCPALATLYTEQRLMSCDVTWCWCYTDKCTDGQSTLQCTTATWELSESNQDFIDLQILEWYASSDNLSIATNQLTLTISPVKVLSGPANQNPTPMEATPNRTLFQYIRIPLNKLLTIPKIRQFLLFVTLQKYYSVK